MSLKIAIPPCVASIEQGVDLRMTYQLLKLSEVLHRARIARAVLYRDMEKRRFPRPLNIGGKAVRWRTDEIEDWLNARPRAAIGQTQ